MGTDDSSVYANDQEWRSLTSILYVCSDVSRFHTEYLLHEQTNKSKPSLQFKMVCLLYLFVFAHFCRPRLGRRARDLRAHHQAPWIFPPSHPVAPGFPV